MAGFGVTRFGFEFVVASLHGFVLSCCDAVCDVVSMRCLTREVDDFV